MDERTELAEAIRIAKEMLDKVRPPADWPRLAIIDGVVVKAPEKPNYPIIEGAVVYETRTNVYQDVPDAWSQELAATTRKHRKKAKAHGKHRHR